VTGGFRALSRSGAAKYAQLMASKELARRALAEEMNLSDALMARMR
jgi:DNA repair protein RadC